MIVAEETVYEGWTTLKRVALKMANGGVEERHIEHHGEAVAVLPYDSEQQAVLLVSLPRAPVLRSGDDNLLEVVAGALEDEHPEQCARREAMEEAGVRLSSLEFVGKVWSMPSLSTERICLYLAPYSSADRVGPGGGAEDENEQIQVHEMSAGRVRDLAQAGGIADLKTLALVQALQLRHPALFR